MKPILCIFFAVLLLTNCTGKNTTAKEENNSKVTAEEYAPLIIGGRQYRGQLGERVEVEKGSWRIPNDPVDCTVKDIDKLFIMTLWVDPENPERRSGIENLESLHNLKELHIRGENLNKVDFSPISSLINLEELEIEGDSVNAVDFSFMSSLINLKRLYIKVENLDLADFSPISSLINLERLEIKGNITHLPDMNNLQRLKIVDIKKGALESLTGLGGAGIEKLEINTSRTSNIMLKINDMKNLTELKSFVFEGGKIDLSLS
ncbi:MAG: hypothetical protein LBQ89_03625 [Treponema sp.]|nr:hypothetical protein [Treponema sp.]